MSDNSANKGEEQSFTIQPHPATTNDPQTDPALNPSLRDQVFNVAGKPGPAIVDPSKLGDKLSKEEASALSAQLNKD